MKTLGVTFNTATRIDNLYAFVAVGLLIRFGLVMRGVLVEQVAGLSIKLLRP